MKLVKALVGLAFLLLTQSVNGKRCRCQTNRDEISETRSSMKELASRLDELEKENKGERAKRTLNERILNQHKTIFSQMELIGTYTYKPGDRLNFTSTVTNVGNAYDIQHGFFEAPYDGTYLFSVTLCTSPGNAVVFHIVQDDDNIREGFSGDSSWHTCGSSTAVTQMKSGSTVWVEIVRVNKGKMESAWGTSSFTGVFLNNYQKP